MAREVPEGSGWIISFGIQQPVMTCPAVPTATDPSSNAIPANAVRAAPTLHATGVRRRPQVSAPVHSDVRFVRLPACSALGRP